MRVTTSWRVGLSTPAKHSVTISNTGTLLPKAGFKTIIQTRKLVKKRDWRERERERERILVIWYFEPCLPQRITSGPKETSICLLFTLHTSHQTTNSLKNTQLVLTQIYTEENIHKRQTLNFRRISPFGITPVKNAHRARTRWYCGPFRRLINTEFKKKKV